MGKTKIEWTERTWNPVSGCSPVSAGCEHCYAARMAKRLAGRGGYPAERPFAVTLHPDKLNEPLKWRDPQRVFVVSMGDLFHEEVPFEYIERIFAVMEVCVTHTFQLLTKRPERALEFFEGYYDDGCRYYAPGEKPLSNIWFGVTAENQQAADERIPALLQIPAAVRFVSVEPMLGAVDLVKSIFVPGVWDEIHPDHNYVLCPSLYESSLDWVIVGGETGPGARPMHPQWVRYLRDQCECGRVPFFFKSWGNWFPRSQWEHNPDLVLPDDSDVERDRHTYIFPDGEVMHRVGKRRAGRLLDGVAWNEFPEVRS